MHYSSNLADIFIPRQSLGVGTTAAGRPACESGELNQQRETVESVLCCCQIAQVEQQHFRF